MYENMINTIMLWQRRLEEENELRNSHLLSILVEESPTQCPIKHKTIFTWNYKLEKNFQPLFNSYSQDYVSTQQPC
ncbi:MAG: hypothetical protein CVU42_10745 [Chloroflexi bacterium HGW-Chloroflexi-4]|jgi:hypothetical protein|nr:MAG: hypothetical protein CVU42_10745 [Chloroflexi bacterium HGW-Chloroflexi-4]